jgi:hypothetical protein
VVLVCWVKNEDCKLNLSWWFWQQCWYVIVYSDDGDELKEVTDEYPTTIHAILYRSICQCSRSGPNTSHLPQTRVRICHLILREIRCGYEIRVSYSDLRTIDCITFHNSQK